MNSQNLILKPFLEKAPYMHGMKCELYFLTYSNYTANSRLHSNLLSKIMSAACIFFYLLLYFANTPAWRNGRREGLKILCQQ